MTFSICPQGQTERMLREIWQETKKMSKRCSKWRKVRWKMWRRSRGKKDKENKKKPFQPRKKKSYTAPPHPTRQELCVLWFWQSKMRPALIMPLYTIKMELCIRHTTFYGVMHKCGPWYSTRTKAVVEMFLQELIAVLVVQTRGGRGEQHHY